jgi:hypothetical protein
VRDRDTATKTKVAQAAKIWRTFHKLATLACQARVTITEAEWLTQAQEFGKLFIDCYEARNTTPYIHIFVYHVGYFLETYEGIEKFANYALECKHRTNKIRLRSGTSGFSGGPVQAATQQLNAQTRTEHHDLIYPPAVKRGRKRGWAESNLEFLKEQGDVEFAVSSTVL